jgi:hypothetical protein
MKEILSFFTFGIGALCFVAFFTALKPLAVTAAGQPGLLQHEGFAHSRLPIAGLCSSIVASRRAAIVTIAPEGCSLLKQEGADHAGPNYISFEKSNVRLESTSRPRQKTLNWRRLSASRGGFRPGFVLSVFACHLLA